MTYVMSDLHGRFEQYRQMLEKIKFSGEDVLYILGDVVDRGPEPMRILLDMSLRPNVYPLLGNHDRMAKHFLPELYAKITCETRTGAGNTDSFSSQDLSTPEAWLADGGQTTLEDFCRLSPTERTRILNFFSMFLPFYELVVGANRFVLVHGGLADFDPERPLQNYDEFSLVTEHTDYTRRYFPDRYLVTGHVPTGLIDPSRSGRIFRQNGHIAIDCGNGWGGTLGCLRLEDFEEFYI